MLRASNLHSQTVNKSTVLSLPLDIKPELLTTTYPYRYRFNSKIK